MAKKYVGMRITDNAFNFLSAKSFEMGHHHKLSESLPNITATVESIITNYEKLNALGLSEMLLSNEEVLSDIKKVVEKHRS